jgi:hypothetical protein
MRMTDWLARQSTPWSSTTAWLPPAGESSASRVHRLPEGRPKRPMRPPLIAVSTLAPTLSEELTVKSGVWRVPAARGECLLMPGPLELLCRWQQHWTTPAAE